MGDGSPHLAVHPSGDYIAVAHYGSGHTSILPVRADRGVWRPPRSSAARTMIAARRIKRCSTRAAAPCSCPASSRTTCCSSGSRTASSTYNDPPTVAVAGGPRHLALSPDERHAYVLSELESTITSFDYDAATGTLSESADDPEPRRHRARARTSSSIRRGTFSMRPTGPRTASACSRSTEAAGRIRSRSFAT